MIKKTIILFFTLAILAQSSRNALTGLWFLINREYIAQKLCINVDRPELECAGKCYLDKLLKDNAETNNEPVFAASRQRSPLTYILQNCTLPIIPPKASLKQVSSFTYFFNYSFQAVFSVFRPPNVLL